MCVMFHKMVLRLHTSAFHVLSVLALLIYDMLFMVPALVLIMSSDVQVFIKQVYYECNGSTRQCVNLTPSDNKCV